MATELAFIKFGGSLITDKTRRETARHDVILRLAGELRAALAARPDLRLLLGHGSGSFGHWHGSRYHTRDGVHGHEAWTGFAHVAASAARLNRLVTDTLLEAGVAVLGVRPSSSARCRDGALIQLDSGPIRHALSVGLVPMVHGDVALDTVRGGTIISTEEIISYLAQELQPRRILLLGETPGVLRTPAGDQRPEVVPFITPAELSGLASSLGASQAPDVTGGMLSKVRLMLDLVQRIPELQVHILSGHEPGLLTQVLLDPDVPVGTRIRA